MSTLVSPARSEERNAADADGVPFGSAEHHFTSHDSTLLFYRSWLPADDAPAPLARAVILLHRGHEHSGRWG